MQLECNRQDKISDPRISYKKHWYLGPRHHFPPLSRFRIDKKRAPHLSAARELKSGTDEIVRPTHSYSYSA